MTVSLSNEKHNLLAWMICCMVVAGVVLIYLAASVAGGQGEIVLPLDDTYIHFQYARQLANGQPYVYNPGEPPTSGATSFIYPFVLAAGYLAGFQGLNLGLWALGVGGIALLASTWLVYLLARRFDTPYWLALIMALTFPVTGSISWHFMSGMETGLVVTLTLATLYALVIQHYRGFVLAASLLALSRPEGSIMAIIAVLFMAIQVRHIESWQRLLPWLAIPVLAAGVQPLINLMLAGSITATGTQAKSIFGIVPFFWDTIIARIWDHFTRMWVEFVVGTERAYTPIFIVPLAVIGWLGLLRKRERRQISVLLAIWLLVITAAISTLDTAFWHFKRYQVPLIALFYPLAAWGAGWLWLRLINAHFDVSLRRTLAAGLSVVALLIILRTTSTEFLHLYIVNVKNIAAQPLPMARWLAANTPQDTVIAVHDVGMIRYLSERHTVDVVGLTTPGAADAWRNGPGAVAEFLLSYAPRPDYIAAYTTARGLNYLEATGLYGEMLAGFPAEYDPADNVALAAEFQGIYRVEWEQINRWPPILQTSFWGERSRENNQMLAFVDVANLTGEAWANYDWKNNERHPGFPTEVYEMDYVDCLAPSCRILDAGRRINGEESFSLQFPTDVEDGSAILLVTRVHPANAGTFDVYANGEYVATRWIPQLPGRWLEIATRIPGAYFSNPMHIRIEPHIADGYYMPYYHATYLTGELPPEPDVFAATYQDGAIMLADYDLEYTVNPSQLEVSLDWYTDGSAKGDYKVFIHVYDDIDSPPITQTDLYPGNGTLPPGNWLPGLISDSVVVDLRKIPPGIYRVGVGFYNPFTFERLSVTSAEENVDENNGRLFIGTVEIIDG